MVMCHLCCSYEVECCSSVLCVQEAEALVTAVLPSERHDAAPEIAVYLKEAVGNSTRIDYGTGLCGETQI